LANNIIQVKRTSTAGRTPNTTASGNLQYISAGGLALNMTDKTFFTSDGTNLIYVGSNTVDQYVSNSLTLPNDKNIYFKTVNTSASVGFRQQNDDNFVFYSTNTAYGQRAVWSIFANSITSAFSVSVPTTFNGNVTLGGVALSANGGTGSAGQVLTTNGTSTYWSTAPGSGTVTSIATGNGMTGGPITSTGTVSVLANTGVIANTNGLFVNSTYITSLSANLASPAVLGSTTANGASLTYANVSGQTNTDTLYVNTSANIASSMLANSTGFFPSSNTVGSVLGNTTARWIITANSLIVSGSASLSSVVSFNLTTGNINAIAQTTGSINLGGPTQTGSIVIGVSTNNQTLAIANGATISGNVKTISVGENGVAGSQTNITIGSSLSNTLLTINSNNTLISGNVGIGTTSPSYKLQVNGSFAATTKSFVIDHPTKLDMKLRYGSLEGPENGVYVRGHTTSSVITLPDHWEGLVDPGSITVSLTPIGKSIMPSVFSYNNKKIVLDVANNVTVDCFYHVFGERKDVDKLVVEF